MGQYTADVAVIGAGTIGTAIAWRCAQRGLEVALVDPGAGRGAWHAAAGMLAPITELHYAETALFELSRESLARYPQFVAELTDRTGRSITFWPCGTLSIAWDAADLAALRDLHAFGATVGADATLISGRELRELEPALSPGLPGGLLAAGDHQVDPRTLHAALSAAAAGSGVHTWTAQAQVLVSGGRATGIALTDGTEIAAGTVVVAAGAWAGQIAGVPSPFAAPIRPVKGQTLRLRLPGEPRLRHVVRASVKGTPVYIVPRPDGRVVVGASSEEAGFDVTPRAGAVYEVLRDAQTVLPELGEAAFEEVSTGLRPGSPDNAPLIGPSGLDGLVHASGHYRNGILLTPVTADAVADTVTDGALPDSLAPFRPTRFAEVAA